MTSMMCYFLRDTPDGRKAPCVIDRGDGEFELRFDGRTCDISSRAHIQDYLRRSGYDCNFGGSAWYSVNRHSALI